MDVIINVLPFDKETFIIISGLRNYKEHIKYYIRHFEDPLNVTNMAETWMVHGSDHWFLKPNIWY